LAKAPSITLFGAAGEVTGSCTLIETEQSLVVVDFGMIQGTDEEEQRNRTPPRIDWPNVHAVVVTHGHIDHCGRLPMLAQLGFTGTIWMTPATADLLPRILRGSASLQQVRRHEWRQGTAPIARAIFEGEPLHLPKVEQPEPPVLFVNSHVTSTIARVRSLPYDEPMEIAPDVTLRFLNAGHVLGAASAELTCGFGAEECVVLCSGDLGPQRNELHEPPVAPRRADIVIVESTNGIASRNTPKDAEAQLAAILAEAGPRDERVLIPTFAIGRAQQLILRLGHLARRQALGGLQVYVDSAMAARVADRFHLHREYLSPVVNEIFERGDSPFDFPALHRLTTRNQSLALTESRRGGVILAGAGFCDAGPILHHLLAGLDREDCRIVLAGYHPAGSIGDGLRRGARLVEINGKIIEVKARVSEVDGLSGHGGREDILGWLGGIEERPTRVLLNHGTEASRIALEHAIVERLGLSCARPLPGETHRI
jgi:metallo-beta-lactamase family protein